MFDPGKKVASVVSELLLVTTEIRPSENNTLDELRPFNKLLGVVSTETCGLVCMACRTFEGCLAPLLCLEYKRVLGEGGCDLSTRAAYSVREFLALNKACGYRVFLHLS